MGVGSGLYMHVSPKVFIASRDIDRCVAFKFREIWPTVNRWNLSLFTWQNYKISPSYSQTREHRQNAP